MTGSMPLTLQNFPQVSELRFQTRILQLGVTTARFHNYQVEQLKEAGLKLRKLLASNTKSS